MEEKRVNATSAVRVTAPRGTSCRDTWRWANRVREPSAARGKAPPWLFGRTVRLSRAVLGHMTSEHGPDDVLRRLSDPFWFQALGCVLRFD
jgi:Protein of unknown function (DUF763)